MRRPVAGHLALREKSLALVEEQAATPTIWRPFSTGWVAAVVVNSFYGFSSRSECALREVCLDLCEGMRRDGTRVCRGCRGRAGHRRT